VFGVGSRDKTVLRVFLKIRRNSVRPLDGFRQKSNRFKQPFIRLRTAKAKESLARFAKALPT
jgi:hypothetical protein